MKKTRGPRAYCQYYAQIVCGVKICAFSKIKTGPREIVSLTSLQQMILEGCCVATLDPLIGDCTGFATTST